MLFPLVVVLGGWPSELMAIISLGLALVGAYVLSRFHQYFKPKGGVTSWFVPSDVKTIGLPEGVGLLVSGSKQFIKGIIVDVGPTHRIIISVVTKLRGASV
jgi:hypothetical protein